MSWLKDLSEAFRRTLTEWGSLETHDDQIFEAISTTHPPSMRTLVLRDDNLDGTYDFLTASEIDSILTNEPQVYSGTVPEGESWVIRGQNRNPYVPGFESVSGQGFQVRIDPDTHDNRYLPNGVEVELGPCDFESDGDEDGIALRYEPTDAKYGLYEAGNYEEVKSVENGDWDSTPFSGTLLEPVAQTNDYILYRHTYDLYGGGQSALEMRVRDTDEDRARVIQPVNTYRQSDPMLEQYNLPNSVRITNTAYSDGVEFAIGPKQFYNIHADEVPSRPTDVAYRNVTPNHNLNSAEGTVVATFRIGPDHVEVPITPSTVGHGGSEAAVVEARVTPADHLTWSGGDLTVDDNWIAPQGYDVRDRALEVLDAAPGDVTIDTAEDEDGQVKMKGHVLRRTASGEGGIGAGEENLTWFMDDYRYVIITARSSSQSEIPLITSSFRELW